MPLVTIVVPVHNREDLLPETLDSVLAQTFTDWECIVVDDHSTDNSLAVAQRYSERDPRFRAFALPEPKRYGNAARNFGLSLARGEFVNFLDSDDLFAPSKLDLQLVEYVQNPQLDAVTCRHCVFWKNPTKDAIQAKFADQSQWLEVIWEPGARGGIWQTAGPLWRKWSILSLGGWNEELRVWQDADLHLRAILANQNILLSDQILLYVRSSGHDRVSAKNKDGSSDRWRRKSLITGWRHLENAHQTTNTRRMMIALRLYYINKNSLKHNKPYQSLFRWFDDCRKIDLGIFWALYGAALMFSGHYRRLQFINRRLRPGFLSHIEELKPPLPDIGDPEASYSHKNLHCDEDL